MSMKHIQFQPGLSRLKFLKQFGSEKHCVAELEKP